GIPTRDASSPKLALALHLAVVAPTPQIIYIVPFVFAADGLAVPDLLQEPRIPQNSIQRKWNKAAKRCPPSVESTSHFCWYFNTRSSAGRNRIRRFCVCGFRVHASSATARAR